MYLWSKPISRELTSSSHLTHGATSTDQLRGSSVCSMCSLRGICTDYGLTRESNKGVMFNPIATHTWPTSSTLQQQGGEEVFAMTEWIEDSWQRLMMGTLIPPTADLDCTPIEADSFCLLQPLRHRQRKSYSGENRFLTPKPVIVLMPGSDIAKKIERCEISDVFGGPVGVRTTMSLTFLRTTPICLKVCSELEEQTVRLLFDIDYQVEGIAKRTTLTSSPFIFVRGRDRN
ncbi:hypothetical protein PROFUN_01690 [Planoprotostelium fungivorum]|uniref:Uncharacterized protein n=1 Tax=Planoprotostelium fungivorum TaxID=1890364 RepID=A0A2P6MW97_9EUKA|nr:hypothetical protein PROFUN_01690 [Planoprotostelium fungivorum]